MALQISGLLKSEKNYQINLMNSVNRIYSNRNGVDFRKIDHLEMDIDFLLNLLEKNREKVAQIRIIDDNTPIKDYNNIYSAMDDKKLDYSLIEV